VVRREFTDGKREMQSHPFCPNLIFSLEPSGVSRTCFLSDAVFGSSR